MLPVILAVVGAYLIGDSVLEDKKYAKGGQIDAKSAKKRLEQIRKALRAESISYGELAELESLKEYIDEDDVELRQAAGIPEFDEDEYKKGGMTDKGGETGVYEVVLSATPNVDYEDIDYRGYVKLKPHKKKVKSIEDAQKIVRNFIEENELGGGNWNGGDVFKDGKKIGYISYNGRFWSETKMADGGMMAKGGKIKGIVKISLSEISDIDFRSLSDIFESNDAMLSIDEPEEYVVMDFNELPDGNDKDDAYEILGRYNVKKYAKGGKLVGKQKNLDVNKNGKLDAEDFKMLRKGKKMAKGGQVKIGDKFYDKKFKQNLEILKEMDDSNAYYVKWDDGKEIPYSTKNINFFIEKKIWVKK
jgi:hypothetical protein